MTRVDGADAILCAEQRIEQMIVLHAWKRVDRVEPVPDQRGNDRFGGGHLWHRIRLSLAATVGRSLQGCRAAVFLDKSGPACAFPRAFRKPSGQSCIVIEPTPAALCAKATSARPCGS